jgi:hypothetical protein
MRKTGSFRTGILARELGQGNERRFRIHDNQIAYERFSLKFSSGPRQLESPDSLRRKPQAITLFPCESRNRTTVLPDLKILDGRREFQQRFACVFEEADVGLGLGLGARDQEATRVSAFGGSQRIKVVLGSSQVGLGWCLNGA